MAQCEGEVTRKKKRWSLGGLFRRRKTPQDIVAGSNGGDIGAVSSSDDDGGGWLSRRGRRNGGSATKDVTGHFVVTKASSWGNVNLAADGTRKRAEANRLARDHPESSSGEEEDGSYSSSVASTNSLNRRSRAARTERYLRRQVNRVPAPPTPPERRSSRHFGHPHNGDLEQALGELEAIYNSLKFAEDEGSIRRPIGTPPRPADDMAVRRWTKSSTSVRDSREVLSQAGSYLLLTPTLSPPPPPFPRDPLEPDITLDDVVYRNMSHINNKLKISDPQPPFGIPLSPVSPAPNSDYLHAEPHDDDPSTTGRPHVVLDDLAFRNLRKDENKRKATRSLSANLSHIIIGDRLDREVNNNLIDEDVKQLKNEDIPQDLRLAQRMLDIRLNNLRNKIKEQERESEVSSPSRGLIREPQRSRYGADGVSRYADLHAAQPRIVIKDEWKRPPTPDRKTSKEDLRKKFFAEAYKNLDKTNGNFKPPPKPPNKERSFEHNSRSKVYYQPPPDPVSYPSTYRNYPPPNHHFMYIPPVQQQYQTHVTNPTVTNADRKSLSPQRSPDSSFYQLNPSINPLYRPPSHPNNFMFNYSADPLAQNQRSPVSSRHQSPNGYSQNGSPGAPRRFPIAQNSSCYKTPNYLASEDPSGNIDQKSPKISSRQRQDQISPLPAPRKSPITSSQQTPMVTPRLKSPSTKGNQQGSPTATRAKSSLGNTNQQGSPVSSRHRMNTKQQQGSPISYRRKSPFNPNAESFPKMEQPFIPKQNSPQSSRRKGNSSSSSRQESPVPSVRKQQKGNSSSVKSQHNSPDQNICENCQHRTDKFSEVVVEHSPVYSVQSKKRSPPAAKLVNYNIDKADLTSIENKDNQSNETYNLQSSNEIPEKKDKELFQHAPTLEELFLMYSHSASDERIVEGEEEGRGSPSGEEVRRILEAGEESLLLKQLEEEAKATSLLVDQQLQRLAAKSYSGFEEKEVNGVPPRSAFKNVAKVNDRDSLKSLKSRKNDISTESVRKQHSELTSAPIPSRTGDGEDSQLSLYYGQNNQEPNNHKSSELLFDEQLEKLVAECSASNVVNFMNDGSQSNSSVAKHFEDYCGNTYKQRDVLGEDANNLKDTGNAKDEKDNSSKNEGIGEVWVKNTHFCTDNLQKSVEDVNNDCTEASNDRLKSKENLVVGSLTESGKVTPKSCSSGGAHSDESTPVNLEQRCKASASPNVTRDQRYGLATGDIDQMKEECNRIGDLLSELARDLERVSPPENNHDDNSKNDNSSGSQVVSFAYCMAVAQHLTCVDPLTLLAIMFAVASLFLFLYL